MRVKNHGKKRTAIYRLLGHPKSGLFVTKWIINTANSINLVSDVIKRRISFLAVPKMLTKHHQTNSMTLQFLREWGRDLLCGQIGQIRQKANCQHGFQSLFCVNEIFLEAIELKKHNPWKQLKMPNKGTKNTELRHRIIKSINCRQKLNYCSR